MDDNVQQNEKVKDIIMDLVNEEEDTELDVPTIINLAERIDKSFNERKEALYVLEDLFKNAPSGMILKGVQILETLVKNCNQKFHLDVDSKDFQDAILKLLNRKRGKKSFFKQIKQNNKNWEVIENKVLYLIQLWYDTFMMHEGDYPNIMNNYKLLRKEGIKFPERDPNEMHMINFKGIKSPIFGLLEEQQMQKSGIVPKKKREELITKPAQSDYAQKFEINQQNLDKLVDNLQIISAIIESAQQPEDFQTDFAQDIMMFLKSFKTKIMLLNSQNKLDDLKEQKKQILEFYKQTRLVIKNFEQKSQEIEQLNRAIQESAIEEYSKIAEKTNYVKKLKSLNIAPPTKLGDAKLNSCDNNNLKQNNQVKQESTQQQKQIIQNDTAQQQQLANSQNITKQQSNNIDLLDFDFDQPQSNTAPTQLHQNQTNSNTGQNPSQPVQSQIQQGFQSQLQQFNQQQQQFTTYNPQQAFQIQQQAFQNQQQIYQNQQQAFQNQQQTFQNSQQTLTPPQFSSPQQAISNQQKPQTQVQSQLQNTGVDLFSDQNTQDNNKQSKNNNQNLEEDDFWGEIATRK
ncbi:VHS domain protein (macronuclear) [Tetrahymena thermophila SB210]|uniref:VHS domain protein n=1 Tax=Tetrahymena thermophila (strain SB210) TaxID=312017 RepID=I7M3L2_TETTS|nr:VHS domain protein [Tetrahymena thermophila SB210]EAS03672.2 VHS domain protein [Tetrahymena thermophila SB210]|eukprot:XP_001023917.2 VHS domain protein [Tetrahymena thermophila SB210]